jgi:hypothetical protein
MFIVSTSESDSTIREWSGSSLVEPEQVLQPGGPHRRPSPCCRHRFWLQLLFLTGNAIQNPDSSKVLFRFSVKAFELDVLVIVCSDFPRLFDLFWRTGWFPDSVTLFESIFFFFFDISKFGFS